MYLSKSKYCGLWQCPKMAWLRQYKPEEAITDESVQASMDAGNEVGDFAMGLFGDYVEVTVLREDGRPDIGRMIECTEEEMQKGTENICEASFSYNGLYCAVDILRKQGGGWAIYEVKSASSPEHQVYYADVAYQKYVLEHCGVTVKGVFLVTIDSSYVLQDSLDITKLFRITDVYEEACLEEKNVPALLSIAERILNSEEAPAIGLSEHCRDPYDCAFWDYCTKALPKPNVFDLYRMRFSSAIDYCRMGVVSYEDLLQEPSVTNEKQLRQIEYELKDKGTYIDKDGIRDFLNTLSYPLYFLDFETMQQVIPLYEGTRPYMQITFQYSLHYIEEEGGELKHKEFLAESGPDPRRALAEQLCRDIPEDVCVTAYNKGFECGRIKELANAFPDLADHLMKIRANIRDLLTPFQAGYYYNRRMGGSFSIKSVLPAIFPDDPELDYHNLEGVHHGGEAMTLFPKLKEMPEEERKKARHDLLKYCELDTYAMVKIWEELKRAAE